MPDGPVMIDGIAVDAGLLAARAIRRCRAGECDSYCCSGGVYISLRQAEDILANAALVQPHLPAERRDPAGWFDGDVVSDDDHPHGEPVMGTQVVPDSTHPVGESCVFLRPDRKCALQVAGQANGQHPWRFKPFYCALHPLVYDQKMLALAEGSEMYQEGGSCNRPAAGPPVPLIEFFRPELELALGETGYAKLAALRGRNGGA